jgi:ketosteroid isomerase-like protein
MRAAVRVATVLALTAGAGGGCGSADRDQVRAKVEQFAQAVRLRDYKSICANVLAPDLLSRLAVAGVPCEQALAVGLGRTRDPLLGVGRVTVSGDHASVLTLSGARGQQSAIESVELVRTHDGWRIAALGSPARR